MKARSHPRIVTKLAMQGAADFPYCLNPLTLNIWHQGAFGNFLLVNAPHLPRPPVASEAPQPKGLPRTAPRSASRSRGA